MNARSDAVGGQALNPQGGGSLWSGPLGVQPTALAALAHEIGAGPSGAGGTGAPVWPPRPSDAVFASIQRGERPLAIEVWSLLADDAWWAVRRLPVASPAAGPAAVTLWRASCRDLGLAADLRWAAGAVLGGLSAGYVREIGDTWDAASEPDRSTLRWLAEGDAAALATASRRSGVAPRRFLLDAGMPGDIDLAHRAGAAAVAGFVAKPVVADEHFALECLRWMPPHIRDGSVESILRELSDDDASRLPLLRAQLIAWYTERGETLSESAWLRLQQWKGMAVWDDVEHFIERLFNRRVADLDEMLGAYDKSDEFVQARSALSRVAIWSNYSAEFSAVRIFVTKRQRKLLERPDGTVPTNVGLVKDSASPAAIFAVGSYVVIQPLYHQRDSDPIERCLRIFQGPGWTTPAEAYEAIRALTPKGPTSLTELDRVECFGQRWQSNLFRHIEQLGLPYNRGLARFRGFKLEHLNSKGLPR